MKLPVPFEVSYTTVGNKKTRNVIGVISPTVLNQKISFNPAKPVFVDMGDIDVDWQKTTPGFELLMYGIVS